MYLKNVTKNCTRSIKLLCCENAICKRKAKCFLLLKSEVILNTRCFWGWRNDSEIMLQVKVEKALEYLEGKESKLPLHIV